MQDTTVGILTLAASVLVLVAAVAGAKAESGIASHYSTRDHDQPGTKTACGPPLRDSGVTAAHRSLPCGSKVLVTNHRNGNKVVVTITDRGPFVKDRIIDVSLGAARALGFSGLTYVTVMRQ